MKRIVILFALSIAVCVGMACFCTACMPGDSLAAESVFSGTESNPPQREATPSPAPTPSPESSPRPKEGHPAPDACGIIQTVGQGTMTVVPVVMVDSKKGVAAAGGTSGSVLTVDISEATIETMRIYNGGNEEPELSDESVLQPDRQVYLYGVQRDEELDADRVVVLQIGDDKG